MSNETRWVPLIDKLEEYVEELVTWDDTIHVPLAILLLETVKSRVIRIIELEADEQRKGER